MTRPCCSRCGRQARRLFRGYGSKLIVFRACFKVLRELFLKGMKGYWGTKAGVD